MIGKWLGLSFATLLAGCATTMAPDDRTAAGSLLSERVKQLTRGTAWKQVAAIPAQFDTHHPQGMVKIGDTLYMSSVEITTPTKRFEKPQGDYDRDTGAGVGHLFKLDMKGNRLADLTLGEGTIYHPGGIDYDGRYIWVAVAEYWPNSRSIIYRVDPATMQATEVFRYDDHIGGIVHDRDERTLHGVSWGSRRFYRWTLDSQGRVGNADVASAKLRVESCPLRRGREVGSLAIAIACVLTERPSAR